MKTGPAIAEILKREGVEYLFAYPRQPSDRALRRGRHPPDHRAPGAHRPAHGRRHVAPDHGPQDGRVLHAERPGLGERLWRRRPGLRRIGAAAGHPGGLSAPHRPRAAQLQLDAAPWRTSPSTPSRSPSASEIAEHHAPRLQPAAQRPRLAGDRRAPGRRLCRGRARAADLRAGGRHQVRPRSGGGDGSRQGAGRGQAAGDLCRPGRALGRGLCRAEGAGRAAGHPGLHQPRRARAASTRPIRCRSARAAAPIRRRCATSSTTPTCIFGIGCSLHRDQLRHLDAAGQDGHPRHARSRPTSTRTCAASTAWSATPS